eukprot:4328699-Amphidinium_carterae.1
MGKGTIDDDVRAWTLCHADQARMRDLAFAKQRRELEARARQEQRDLEAAMEASRAQSRLAHQPGEGAGSSSSNQPLPGPPPKPTPPSYQPPTKGTPSSSANPPPKACAASVVVNQPGSDPVVDAKYPFKKGSRSNKIHSAGGNPPEGGNPPDGDDGNDGGADVDDLGHIVGDNPNGYVPRPLPPN